MDQWETVDQYRNIIPILVSAVLDGILVDDLEGIVVDVLLIYQTDVLGGVVIADEILDMILLNLPGLLSYGIVR